MVGFFSWMDVLAHAPCSCTLGLSSFCCHEGEMGQSVQPGMLAGAGQGHTLAAPVMQEPSSHRDPGTKGPTALLEVPATTAYAEIFSSLKTDAGIH